VDSTTRKFIILKALIEEYIESAEPVGSKTLLLKLPFSLSSATVRSILSELETEGYLEQPHTSAGRIPSDLGYRYYVNHLMERPTVSADDLDSLSKVLNSKIGELDKLLAETNQALAKLTSHPAFTIFPKVSGAFIHRFEIVTIDQMNFVVVLVTNTGIVKNKLIKLKDPIVKEYVPKICTILNDRFTRIPLALLAHANYEGLDRLDPSIKELISRTLDFLKSVLSDLSESSVAFGGSELLLTFPEYKNAEKAHEILEYFATDSHAMELIPESNLPSVSISIGDENAPEPLKNASLVISSYKLAGDKMGYVGIVGPTRMDYAKIAARLQLFSENLSKILDDILIHEDEGNE